MDVLRDLLPERWKLKTELPNLGNLNKWAAEARHPEAAQEPTEADASEAVEHARAVWTSVSTELTQHGFLV